MLQPDDLFAFVGVALCLCAGPIRAQQTPEFAAVYPGPGGGVSYSASCALTKTGELYCWMFDGALGRPASVSQTMTRVGTLRFREIENQNDVCGLADDGKVYCWALGMRAWNMIDPRPADPDARHEFEARVSAMGHPVATARDDRGVTWYVWPDFDGPRAQDAVKAPPLTSFSHGGGTAGCGVTKEGVAYCWDTDLIARPVKTTLRFKQIVTGMSGGHTCAITFEGVTWCWHGYPVLYGRKFDDVPSTVPVRLTTEARFTSLTAGAAHICGLTGSGRAYCWGYDSSGQLGRGERSPVVLFAKGTWMNPNDTARAPVGVQPEPVAGDLAFREISAGGFATCGLTADHAVYCWGRSAVGVSDLPEDCSDEMADNSNGELNAAQLVTYMSEYARRCAYRPMRVALPGSVVSLRTGGLSACAVIENGEAYCWGFNRGQLGDGTEEYRAVPVRVSIPVLAQ